MKSQGKKEINCELPNNCCQRIAPNEEDLPIISLSQKDFDQGTYRIRNSGRYILSQGIIFSPSNNAQAPPGTGWFAAMTIETSNVIVDLNGFTLEASLEFLQSHTESIFALIELGNSPFPGDIDGDGFGTMGTAFPEDSSYQSASNLIIENGTLKRSTHWGIHGNNNSNLTLRNLKIRDWEVAGISLNALQGGYFKDLVILGCEHQITVKSIITSYNRTKDILQNLLKKQESEEIRKEIEYFLQEVNLFYKSRPNLFRSPLAYPDGSNYGILITNGQGTNLILSLSLNQDDLDSGQIVSNGYCPHCIKLENVRVRNIQVNAIETVAIGSLISEAEPYGHLINLAPLGFFGLLRWSDAFDSSGNFNPNPFLQAQAYAALYLLQQNPEEQDLFPDNILYLLQSLVEKSSRLFFEHAQPIFGRNFTLIENKGAFGIRIDCSRHIILNNCSVRNIINRGERGATLETIPGGDRYKAQWAPRYIGNDIRGFEFSLVEDLRLINCRVAKCLSQNGDAYGFDLMSGISHALITECLAQQIFGNGDSKDSTNLPSEVYGYRIQSNTGPIHYFKSEAKEIYSPRFALGFVTQSTTGVNYRKCQAHQIEVNSSDLTGLPKRAFGYLAEKSEKTSYSRCFATQIAITGEDGNPDLNSSMAIGFGFSEDRHSEIKGSSISYIRSNHGRAVGILLHQSENINILRNIIAWSAPRGFGIIDKTHPSKSIIISNLLFGIRNENIIAKPMPKIREVTISAPSQHTVMKNKYINIGLQPERPKDFDKLIINNLKDRWILNCGDLKESRSEMETHDITKSLPLEERKNRSPKILPSQPPRPKVCHRGPMADLMLTDFLEDNFN